ncbi:bifunctional DNA-formamidopyrimidine glycosylase/DNA-(apurinic or apyrimidinic site) lyase [Terasakiella sp. A23]|uniref:bifunctional DNA-formamidopyrimidine glycosylase/DNA-(apurinic or apyrimidinic site) lyase n=1 Tax=Terasakiella sp. FCG-A23 TaxID=3080561 RepID=UPI002953EC68|nr:bifunctional DNA-formamidopyrimidine glycosylase/DNA-(apurinic or apyrimidinic site) lyase [Terasakiella sp. A23]MDV7340749.1 bifunctional DNA-formamidopyrimidine glycosylase/DNA-(apurinic or apyrimidinic site) lyase [Terasakiella sp. A23]
MPELPEVETVRLGLLPALNGQVITDVIVRRRDLRTPVPEDFEDRVINQKVLGLDRRSKYVLVHLESGETIIIHLGMSGRIRIEEGNPPEPDKHDHIEFITQNRKCIRFGDPRRFGFVDLIEPDGIEIYPAIEKLGPEPLSDDFDAALLISKLKNKTTSMKAALMDQRIVAGLGNIYVNEALYRAGISPTKKAGKLTRPKAAKLVEVIKDVLTEAIAAGGSSLKDHRQTDGELGYFQHSFKVYGREGEPCTACNKGTIKRIVQQGRSTFHCSVCQQ